jgi:hypothetical protein
MFRAPTDSRRPRRRHGRDGAANLLLQFRRRFELERLIFEPHAHRADSGVLERTSRTFLDVPLDLQVANEVDFAVEMAVNQRARVVTVHVTAPSQFDL